MNKSSAICIIIAWSIIMWIMTTTVAQVAGISGKDTFYATLLLTILYAGWAFTCALIVASIKPKQTGTQKTDIEREIKLEDFDNYEDFEREKYNRQNRDDEDDLHGYE